EDGIRDGHVTGVQTCALPIYKVRNAGRVLCNCTIRTFSTCFGRGRSTADFSTSMSSFVISRDKIRHVMNARALNPPKKSAPTPRSEERRVGKEGRSQ